MKFISLLMILTQTAFAIVDGEQITDESYKQSVALVYNREIYCSGTLIGSRLVATAAHCLTMGAKAFKVPLEEFKKETWIYVGNTYNAPDLPMIDPQYKSEKVFLHPVNDSIYSDIAVIELSTDISLKDPALLLIPVKEMLGKNLIHVGYGQITNGGVKGTKSSMILPLKQLNGWNGLGVGESDVRGPSACHGDSGGSAYMFDKNGRLAFVGIEYALAKNKCGETQTFFVPLTDSIVAWMKSVSKYSFFK